MVENEEVPSVIHAVFKDSDGGELNVVGGRNLNLVHIEGKTVFNGESLVILIKNLEQMLAQTNFGGASYAPTESPRTVAQEDLIE